MTDWSNLRNPTREVQLLNAFIQLMTVKGWNENIADTKINFFNKKASKTDFKQLQGLLKVFGFGWN